MAIQQPIQVTNNPQNNVNQAMQPMQQSQPTQPTQNVTPVTIPVQIQPVVAQNNNAQQVQQDNAPTPVQYTQPIQQTQPSYQNVFNNYQSQYKTEQSMYPNVQIPKEDINTIEGQYKSNYSDAINQLANTILSARFEYNPNEDDLLKQASNYVTQNTFESMNAKGILNSSITAERVAQVVGNLIPQYEKLAREEFDAAFSRMLNTANLLMNMDERQFAYWKDARDQRWKEEEQQYQRSQDALKNAWTRVDELGYVDNEAAKVLGISVGTLSKDAREKKEAREYEMAEWNRRHEIEKQTEMELYQLKQDLAQSQWEKQQKINMENDLALYKAKQNLSTQQQKELEKYSYELKKQYGGTSNSANTVPLSTYDSVIQNRWGIKDDMTNKISLQDSFNDIDNNDEVYSYIIQEYLSGRLSESDFSTLVAKYGITQPGTQKTSSNVNTVNKNSTLNNSSVETWIKALDGNNSALKELGITVFGQYKSNVNNNDARNAVKEALRQIETGEYKFISSQQLMDDLKNHKFGYLHWGF